MPSVPRCSEQTAYDQVDLYVSDNDAGYVDVCESRVLRTFDDKSPLLYAVACRAIIEVQDGIVQTHGQCERACLIDERSRT